MLFGQEHVKHYVETDGEEGHDWQGATVLILTNDGPQVGRAPQHSAHLSALRRRLRHRRLEGRAPEHPGWYLNLEQEPEVTVQVKAEKFSARARTATPEERLELWKLMTGIWPQYDEYQQKTDREIPIVVLDRA